MIYEAHGFEARAKYVSLAYSGLLASGRSHSFPIDFCKPTLLGSCQLHAPTPATIVQSCVAIIKLHPSDEIPDKRMDDGIAERMLG